MKPLAGALVLVLAALLGDAAADQTRSITPCDQGALDPSCGVDPSFDCGAGRVFALQNGCYECVELALCTVPMLGTSEMPTDKFDLQSGDETTTTEPPVLANKLKAIKLRSDTAAIQPDAMLSATATSMRVENAAVSTERNSEVSSWFFIAPGCMALVSIGLAYRAHRSSSEKRFQLLNDLEQDDEINPFTHAQAQSPGDDSEYDDEDEFAGRYEGDEDDDEANGIEMPLRPSHTMRDLDA